MATQRAANLWNQNKKRLVHIDDKVVEKPGCWVPLVIEQKISHSEFSHRSLHDGHLHVGEQKYLF